MKKFLFIGLVISLGIGLTGCQKQANPYKEVLDIMNQTLQKMMEINQKLMEALIAKQNAPTTGTSTNILTTTPIATGTTTETAISTDTQTDIGTGTQTSADPSPGASSPVDTSSQTSVTPDSTSPGLIPGTTRNYQFNGTDGDGKPFSGTVEETEKAAEPGE